MVFDIAEGKTAYLVVGYMPEKSTLAFYLGTDPVVFREIGPEDAKPLLERFKLKQ